MSLWLVTAVGVYDHGVQAIHATREEAETWCREVSFDADGYHSWRIEEWRLGDDGGALRPDGAFYRREEVEERLREQWDKRQQTRIGLGYGDPQPYTPRPVEIEVIPWDAPPGTAW